MRSFRDFGKDYAFRYPIGSQGRSRGLSLDLGRPPALTRIGPAGNSRGNTSVRTAVMPGRTAPRGLITNQSDRTLTSIETLHFGASFVLRPTVSFEVCMSPPAALFGVRGVRGVLNPTPQSVRAQINEPPPILPIFAKERATYDTYDAFSPLCSVLPIPSHTPPFLCFAHVGAQRE